MVGIDVLKKIHFLKELPEEILVKIGAMGELQTFDEGSILVRQDQKQDLVYMLVSGKIFLNARSGSGKNLTLDELGAGQTFGISALLGASWATFTAICAEECLVMTLSAPQMVQLFETDCKLGYAMMQQVAYLFKSRMNKHTQQFLHSLANQSALENLE